MIRPVNIKMKTYVFQILMTLVVCIVFLGLVASFTVDNHETEDWPNVADELHELLYENPGDGQTRLPKKNRDWIGPRDVGQIPGVSVDHFGRPVIFHRGDRIWNSRSFDDQFQFREAFRGPIRQDTILTLNPQDGHVESSWGADLFFMPHGLHIDINGYIWLTDVALHQVFKFKPDSMSPEMVLGEEFVPGSDYDHLCQPTSVVVANTGEIIIADGYCNSRIMIFRPSGKLINILPHAQDSVSLSVPHALTITKRGDVCVADRENMRIICFSDVFQASDNRLQPPLIIEGPQIGRVFSVVAYGDMLFAVDEPTTPEAHTLGLLLLDKDIILRIAGPFKRPHAMAISPNGTELYVTEIGPNIIWKFDLK